MPRVNKSKLLWLIRMLEKCFRLLNRLKTVLISLHNQKGLIALLYYTDSVPFLQ